MGTVLALTLAAMSGRAFVATRHARHVREVREKATADLLRAPMERDEILTNAHRLPASCEALVADALRRGADPNARYAPPPAPPRLTQLFDDVLRIPTCCFDYITPIRGRWPVLLEAAIGGDIDAVRLLLAHGADPNTQVCGQPLLAFLNETWKEYRNYPHPSESDASVVRCAGLIAAAAAKK